MMIEKFDLPGNFETLKESLHYLHVSELKDLSSNLSLDTKGKKAQLIFMIMQFIQTGEKVILPSYPSISLAPKKKIPEIKTDALMLKGAYKNDLKTRMFFKDLIGPHFHFTAFGIDWLDDKWMAGNPPTYEEFAQMWQNEYMARKTVPAIPKIEWAYINFVKRYLEKNPNAGRDDILKEWDIQRHEHKNYVDQFFKTLE